ncbi:hypothetical protein EYD45_09950 [Hyunsoonleella flava]|uniref:DUF3857 domain-containing protein n=1 Tax=Hyunsoonleella flava TaxID=2527939 RepID=A0A4Q9FD71_9FLAO|nr:hypothetical protein [Hyunsoonleella flava]TBN03321.1 hypothetical protein EYD45_09950 [Hyunsoonleella flava]
MRQLLILTFLLILSINSYADTGLAFRYKIELQNGNEKIRGYVYHYTYSDGFKSDKESFLNYFSREFHNTPYIYTEVHSLNLSESFELDFFLPRNRIKFSPEKIIDVKLFEKKQFGVGDKILLIENERVYNLIGVKKFQKEGIDYRLAENCNISIVDFSMKADIKKIKMNLNSLIEKYYNNELESVNQEFFKAFNELKEKMYINNVLIFNYCSAL